MTPADVLQKLLDINKPAARLIFAGLGLLAAAAIAVTWNGSNPAALLLAVYVLGFGILVSVTAWLVTNPRMRAVLGWLLTGTFALFLAGLVDSATGFSGRLAAPFCYVRMFFEPREACEARLYDKTPVTADAPAPPVTAVPATAPAPAAETVPAGEEPAPAAVAVAASRPGDVYLQFRPEMDRARMRALAETLEDLGWSVPNAWTGGEAYDHAPVENEVRFFDEGAREAAMRLAQDLAGPGGIADVILSDQTGSGEIAEPGQLEIWLGH